MPKSKELLSSDDDLSGDEKVKAEINFLLIVYKKKRNLAHSNYKSRQKKQSQ